MPNRGPRITSTNQINSFVLSSNVAPANDIDLLKNEYAAQRTRFTGSNFYEITGDHPASINAGYFAVILEGGSQGNHTYQLQLNMGGATVYDSGAVTIVDLGYPLGFGHPPAILFPLPFDQVISFDQFVFSASMSGGTTLEIRSIMTGFVLQFEHGMAYEADTSIMSAPDLVQTAGGSTQPNLPQVESRRFVFDLPKMSDADREALYAFERSIGLAPFIIDGYPDRTGLYRDQHQFLGRFAANLNYTHWQDAVGGRHRSTLPVVQA